MKSTLKIISAAALSGAVLLLAAPAQAQPKCIELNTTTTCSTNGSTQITTNPGEWSRNQGWPGPVWGGFGWGGYGWARD